jgi:hypothetical protein
MQNITTPTPEATKVGETVTPEVTQTPEPTQEVVSEKKSLYPDWAPTIELSAEEDFAEPGKIFGISWVIIGDLPKDVNEKDLSLSISIPTTFEVAKDSDEIVQDEYGSRMNFQYSTEGKQDWILSADAHGPFTITFDIVYQEKVIATNSLTIEQGFTDEVSSNKREVISTNQKIKLTFPDEFTNEPLSIKIRNIQSQSQKELPFTLSNNTFELNAFKKGTQEKVTQFDRPLTIEVQYDPEYIQGDENSLVMYYFDFDSQGWIPLLSEVDADNHILIGHTDHFSYFDFNVDDWQAGTLPTLKNFQTSGFSGAATYSYPITLPPGPGGLQPSLALTYNSNVVDGATNRTQASWVGMGWDLTTGSIDRNMNGTSTYRASVGNHGGQTLYETRWYTSDDTFSLTLNGQSWMLLPSATISTNVTEYRTMNESFLRIRYYGGTDNYWMIWDKTGNLYKFGDESGSSGHLAKTGTCFLRYDDNWNAMYEFQSLTWTWGLTEARNAFYNVSDDNAIHYDYNFTEWTSLCYGGYYTQQLAMYPKTITYPNGKYRVKFTTIADRLDFENTWEHTIHIDSRLSEIKVEHDPDGNDATTNELIRKYNLAYDDTLIFPNNPWNGTAEQDPITHIKGKTPALVSITEYGNDGTSTLPVTSFTYTDNMHMDQATNGYGGQVKFIYESAVTGILKPWHASEGNDDVRIVAHYDNECYAGQTYCTGKRLIGTSSQTQYP